MSDMEDHRREWFERRRALLRKAEAAWDREMDYARRPFGFPLRLTYPQAAARALAAYDRVLRG